MSGSHSTPASLRSASAHGRPFAARLEANALSLSKGSVIMLPEVKYPVTNDGYAFVYILESRDGTLGTPAMFENAFENIDLASGASTPATIPTTGLFTSKVRCFQEKRFSASDN